MPEDMPGSGPEPRGDRHGRRGGLRRGRAGRGQLQALDHRVTVARGPLRPRLTGPRRQRLTAQQVDRDRDVDPGQRGGPYPGLGPRRRPAAGHRAAPAGTAASPGQRTRRPRSSPAPGAPSPRRPRRRRTCTPGIPRWSACVPKAIIPTGRTRWPADPGWPRSCSGLPLMSMSWPAPALPASARRRPCLTGGPDGGAGWLSRARTSGSSAAAASCPLPRSRNWSGPGMPGGPSDTSAARSANDPATPPARSGHAGDHPLPQRTPGPFRKLDGLTRFMTSLLPAPIPKMILVTYMCRATITFIWPLKLSPRLPWRPLAAASARSRLAGDNNRGQLVTVTGGQEGKGSRVGLIPGKPASRADRRGRRRGRECRIVRRVPVRGYRVDRGRVGRDGRGTGAEALPRATPPQVSSQCRRSGDPGNSICRPG